MTIDRNDPRWTAYVLDELSPDERARFEREMANDPDSAQVLAELRETLALLEEGFRSTEPIGLGADQRAAVLATLAPSTSAPPPSRFSRWSVAAGIAASLLIGFVTLRVVREIPDPAGTSTFDSLEVSPQAANGEQRPLAIPNQTDADRPVANALPAEAGAIDPATPGDLTDREAQATPGTVGGTIRDASGALIPGVRVTATSPDSRISVSTLTNETGQYNFEGLDSDGVELKAELPGFATSTQSVAPGDERPQDVVMQVAGTGATVDVVTAEPTPLASFASGVGSAEAQAFPNGGQGVFDQLAIGGALTETASRLAAVSPPAAPPAPSVFPDRQRTRFSTEEYDRITDNPFRLVSQEPLATFSVDVDTASYANVRRFLNQRTMPPADAVRIEEMVNYFTYDYAPPRDGRPVRINAETASAPWAPEHRLVRIGIQGQQIERDARHPSNLVFLIDVSGSMNEPDKLPLLVDGMKLLVDQLGENDRVAIAVYAGASGLVLDSTPGFRRERILSALERLRAGGSTNGGAGIRLAYDVAVRNFIDGGINRVILATDGDFNVGVTNNGDLTRLIEEEARTGVFLSVLGFGTGNYNDAGLEALADNGNGNYAYIDSIREARKVLVEEIGSTLVTIAKDVKFQVEFNPAEVAAYRLIGYENRALDNQDFNNDAVDAGEIGAGHTVTALFEVVPAGVGIDIPGIDPLRYQAALAPTDRALGGEMLTVKVRYKEPEGDVSELIEAPVVDRDQSFAAASEDFRFASAVASFGMILRDSPYKGSATFDSVLRIAEASRGIDLGEYRREFIELVRRARAIADLER